MTFDPRNDIKALFTNSMIQGSETNSDYSAYVKIDLREDNPNADIGPYEYPGVILLEEPFDIPEVISVDGNTMEHTLTITCNLWIKRENDMKNPDEFIDSVLDTFQNTVIDNHLDLSSDCRLLIWGGMVPVESESQEVFRRTIQIYAIGHKIRT